MKHYKDIRWWHFWDPESGLAGGLVNGVFLAAVIILVAGVV